MKIMVFIVLLLSVSLYSQEKELLIRCDDSGMSHSVNVALEELAQTGIPFSTSVMFTCPWYLEAVEILKKYPHVSVGVHLTLNAEWKNYKWGPVLGMEAVPSLVDSNGLFFPSRATFFANNPTEEDIEKELRAQIERAMATGLDIDYVDYHMGTAVEKPEHRKIVEKLAEEYGLAISRYYAEKDMPNMYSDDIELKLDSLLSRVGYVNWEERQLLVCHLGKDDDELGAMKDQNKFGLEGMSKHRNAELNALLSPKFTALLDSLGIELRTYKDIKDEDKISPVGSGY